MSTPDTVIGAVSGVQLTLGALLRRLHAQGRLEPLVREALAAALIQNTAHKAGLSTTDAELQAAADAFRLRLGLASAAETLAWLGRQRLSPEDFEAAVEYDVLAEKLRRSADPTQVDGCFAHGKEGYDLIVFSQLLLSREDLASELASQIRTEGRELDEVARELGTRPTRVSVLRKQLPRAVAQAMAGVDPGRLVGPVGTSQGFALLLVEEVQPAQLDDLTRQVIENELFEAWLAARMNDAVVELGPWGTP